jgi:hypothetical protein
MLNTESFIQKAETIHSKKYNYSLVDYKKSKLKIKIICFEHGVFEQKPNHHLLGQGCPKCGIINTTNRTRLSHSEIINKFNCIHKNKYDYSLVKYHNFSTKVKIICSKHGIFKQTPKSHIIVKSGCPKCAVIYKANKLKLSQIDVIHKSTLIHKNKYDYSLVEYVNSKEKIKIICPEHGIFEQAPVHHMRGIGCPFCNDSKGELIIKNFLENNNNIWFIRNKIFDDCIDFGKLKFDFYLPNNNMIIEFDGIQHYKPINAFGGETEFINIQRRDKIKNEYCIRKSMQMLRIKYNENIINKLNSVL